MDHVIRPNFLAPLLLFLSGSRRKLPFLEPDRSSVVIRSKPTNNSITVGGKPRRVKASIIGPFAIALSLIMAAFLAATYTVEIRVRDQDLAERLAAVAKLFTQKLDKDTGLMRAVLSAIMANEAIETPFRDRNREALMRVAGPVFQSLRDNHRITHLYFTGADRVNVLRLHSPAEFGDVINRVTMLKAKEDGVSVHGLELGALGTLTLRLVMPWRKGDGILGYLEIGEEIEHLINEIEESLSVDLLVLVDKRFLEPRQWQRGLALMNRQGDWERFGTHALVAQTAHEIPPVLTVKAVSDLRAGHIVELDDRGRALYAAMLPLDDAGGRRIGDVVVIRDITALQSTFRWSIVTVTMFCLLAGAGVLGLFYFALDRVERDYRRQHDLEHQLLRLSTQHHRILQLEKLSALGTMVGGIAHQLNNPLVGVVSMAQLAEREVEDPTRTRELLAEIRRAGEECNTFVHRMLEFSKVSCFNSKPTSMAPIIEETVLLFHQAERRHLPVEVTLPDQPVVLPVDPILIRHALFNLLQNAAQATEGDAAIGISLERAANPDSGAPGWSLSVTDHGKGIDPDVIEKIFVPFFTTRSDGTGLGLPVVQHVVLLHDGYVTTSTQPGGGTRFAIWLPELETDRARDVA